MQYTQPHHEHAFATALPPKRRFAPVPSAEALSAWMETIESKTRRGRRFYTSLAWALGVVLLTSAAVKLMQVLGLFVAGTASYISVRAVLTASDPWLAIMCASAVGILQISFRTVLKSPKWDAKELVRLGGVRAIGPLIELAVTPRASCDMAPIYGALTALLQDIKANDAHLLTTEHRAYLYRVVRTRVPDFGQRAAGYGEFRLAIVKALGQIGDAEAIPIVEANVLRRHRTASQRALRAAAIETLPLLTANAETVTAANTLLRVADVEASNLVRPASVKAQPAERLLRHGED